MIDLGHWDLSIPEGDPVVVITSPRLVAGYSDQYFKPDGSSIRFWAPVSGTSTNLSLNSTHKCNAHPCINFVRRLPAQAFSRA